MKLSTTRLFASLATLNFVASFDIGKFVAPSYTSKPAPETSSVVFWPFNGEVPFSVTGSSIGTTQVLKPTASSTIRVPQLTTTFPLAPIPSGTDGQLLQATIYAIDDCSLAGPRGKASTVCPSYPQTTAADGTPESANYLFYTAWKGGAQMTYQGVATSLPGGREQTAQVGAYCVATTYVFEGERTYAGTTCAISSTTIVRNTLSTNIPPHTTSMTDVGADYYPSNGGPAVPMKVIGSEENVPKEDPTGKADDDKGGAALLRSSAAFCVAVFFGIVWVL